MPRLGDPIAPDEVRAVCYPRRERDVIVDLAYDVLLSTITAGRAAAYDRPDRMPPAVEALGSILAERAGTAPILGGLAHHAVMLGWHKDRQAPPRTWNITILLRPADTFDYLVIGPEAWLMRHGAYVAFDNQRWHGTLHYVPVDRIALTYYVPAPDTVR